MLWEVIEVEKPIVSKVTVSISVGEGGEKLTKAEQLLGMITGRKPARVHAVHTIRDFGIREGMPMGCKVTLRKKEALDFLERALKAKNNTIRLSSFDREGNFAFGIPEYTDLDGIRYMPDTGMFGMDVNVTVERIGYRIKKRKIRPGKIPRIHRVKREETVEMAQSMGVEVTE